MFMTDLTGTIKNLFNRQWAESGRGGLGLLIEYTKYTPIILFYFYFINMHLKFQNFILKNVARDVLFIK